MRAVRDLPNVFSLQELAYI